MPSCQQVFVVAAARQSTFEAVHDRAEVTVTPSSAADEVDSWLANGFESERARSTHVDSREAFSADSGTTGPFPSDGGVPSIVALVESHSKETAGYWTALLDILNLRIERYMTPYIVRIYWAMALVTVLLYCFDLALRLTSKVHAQVQMKQHSPSCSDRAVRALNQRTHQARMTPLKPSSVLRFG